MAGRRTNLALLGLLPAALITGAVTFLVGSGPVRLVVVLHGLVGMALLVLVPWKSTIVRRGIRHVRPGRITSVLLAVFVILALVSGLLHSTGILIAVGSISAIQVHVAASLLLIVPAALHVRRRRIRPRTMDVSRRSVFRGGLIVVGAAGLYYALAGAAVVLGLPGAHRRATGSYEVGSLDPGQMPATIWLLDDVPAINSATFQLIVAAAGAENKWRLEELAGDEVTAVIDCTGGWWAEQQWSGIRVSKLLPPGTTGTVIVTSATGYTRRLPLTDDLLLATGIGGLPLSVGHGAPVRLVVPGRRGFHWVKWVVRIEHTNTPWWLEPPVPLQ